MNTTNIQNKKYIISISAFLLLLTLGSLISLLLPHEPSSGYTADIYQSGTLIRSIPLREVQGKYRFTIKGENNCTNEIEVRPGSIGILSADCPDKLCVGQGFISDSRLPITCLPNRLVIWLRPSDEEDGKPDILTY